MNKPEPCNGITALNRACQQGHVPVIQLLISKGARIDARCKRGEVPLHSAASCGSEGAAICLLDHGADVNAADNEGVTPLIIATGHENKLPLVDLLLIRGADPNLVDKRGSSPLLLAAQGGRTKIVKLLARNGANIHLSAVYGMTALHLATLEGHNDVVDYLIKIGAKFENNGSEMAKSCKYCGSTDVPTMQKCSGCQVVWYCGPECQKKDWREGGDKLQCPRIKKQTELYKQKKREQVKEEVKEIKEREKMKYVSEKMREAFEQLRRGEGPLSDMLSDGASSSRQGRF